MLKFIDGFDQYQSQSGSQLLGSLAAAGYTPTQGMAIAAGRHADTFALELRMSPGAAGAGWSLRTNAVKSALLGVAGNESGRWIAVGAAGKAVTSVDTITWTPLVLGVSVDINHVCDADGRWVLVGDQGAVLISDDNGASWQTKTIPLPAAVLKACHYADGKLVAVGSHVAAGCILVSTNRGDTWSVVANGAGSTGNTSVMFGEDTWMVGGLGGQLLTSTDAVNWTARTFGATTTVAGIAFDGGFWLIPSGRNVRQSSNKGVTWGPVASELGELGDNFTAIVAAEGRWVIAGTRSKVMTSDNRIDWTTRPLVGGSVSTAVSALGMSKGAQAALVAVGGLIGLAPQGTALIFASLAPPTTLSRSLVSDANRVAIGFAHRATSRGRVVSVEGLFDLDWPGALSILGVASSAVPIRNAWYYYELVIDKVAKTVALFVNDTVDIVVPLPASVETMSSFNVKWVAENGAIARVDDVYMLDSATAGGSTLVDRMRPIRIPLRMPTADTDVNWEGSAPSPHYALVGVLPPSEQHFVRSAESGAQELFTSDTPLPPSASVVLAVGVLALAKKSDLDNRQLGLAIGASGASQREVIDTTLSTTPEYSLAIFEKGPGDTPWTSASVLSTPFGVIVRP